MASTKIMLSTFLLIAVEASFFMYEKLCALTNVTDHIEQLPPLFVGSRII
jgi:hypothetical protein